MLLKLGCSWYRGLKNNVDQGLISEFAEISDGQYQGFAIIKLPVPEMETGRVEILRPAGQAGGNTGQVLLSCN